MEILHHVSLYVSVRLYIIFEGWQIESMFFVLFYIEHYIIGPEKHENIKYKHTVAMEKKTFWNPEIYE